MEFFISYGLSMVLIFSAVWLIARYDADLGTMRLILTGSILFGLEILINFLWTVLWVGIPGQILVLASVFITVAAAGIGLVSRIQHTSIVRGTGVMGIYIPVKVVFAILVGAGLVGQSANHSPNPVSVWIRGDLWKVREVASLKLELPAEPVPNSIPVPPGFKKSARFDDHSQLNTGGCLVLIVKLTALNQDVDLDGAVEALVADFSGRTTIEDFSHKVIETTVDGFPARRVTGDLKDRGRRMRFELLIIGSGNTGWFVQIVGGKRPATERANRIFSSIKVIDLPDPVEDPAPEKKDTAKKPKAAPKPVAKSSIAPIAIKVARVVRIADSDVYPVLRKLMPKTRGRAAPEVYILGRTETLLILRYRAENGKQFLGSIGSYEINEQKFIRRLPVTHRHESETSSAKPTPAPAPVRSNLFPKREPKPTPKPAPSSPAPPEAAKPAYPVERTIQNEAGKALEVTITGRSADQVIFKNEEGKEFRYPIEKLNPSDRAFVRGLPVSEE